MKKIFTLMTLPLFAVMANAATGTATYALQSGETHKSGETVELKNDGITVATLTFGEPGEKVEGSNAYADFKAASKNDALKDKGFAAYTEGNNENGDKAGGTFYTIKPSYNGQVEVGVVLNKDKGFFVLQDGTALSEYDGIQVSDKAYTTYSFNVLAGSEYKVYAAGTKLGFYGFNYTFDDSATGSDDLTEAPISWSSTAVVTYKVRDDVSKVSLPTLINEEGLKVTYASTNQAVATIDENGVVTLKNDQDATNVGDDKKTVGTTTISATYQGEEYEETTVKYDIKVLTNIEHTYEWAPFDEDPGFKFDYIWKTESVKLEANTLLIDDDNVKVSTVYAANKSSYSGTYFGQQFPGSVQLGRISADPSENNLTGTENSGNSPLVVTPETDLQLVIIYRKQAQDVTVTEYDDQDANVITQHHCVGSVMNDGKSLWAANQKNVTTKLDQKIYTGGAFGGKQQADGNNDYIYAASCWDLKAGETYTIWARGTTPSVFGIGYIIATVDPVAPEVPTATVEGVDNLENGIDLKGNPATIKFSAADENHDVYAVFVETANDEVNAVAEAVGMTHDELPGQEFALVTEAGIEVTGVGTLYYFAHNPANGLKSSLASIEVTDSTTAIDGIATDANAPVEYFNLQGVRVANPENGIYIRRQGDKVSKVVVK